MKLPGVLFLLSGLLILSGCGGPGASPGISESQALGLRPADAELADTYGRSCRSCHTIAATGAPLTGDSAAWAERLDKGMDTLVDNVVNGFGGMPPYGLCMDCGPAEFQALIEFMAAPPGP